MDDSADDLGERIAAWFKVKNISPAEAAKKLEITRAAVYQWIGTGASKTTPSQKNLSALVDLLGISMVEFYGPVPKVKAKAS
jgi:transcriptional regulator with XRE-family HTH domain